LFSEYSFSGIRDKKVIDVVDEFSLSEKVNLFNQITKGKVRGRGKKAKIEIEYGFSEPFDQLGLESPLLLYCHTLSLTKSYYLYQGSVYLSEQEEDITRIHSAKKENQIEHKRQRIPDDVQIFVWNRDNGVCVKCGTNENLAFDHIIPFSKGGSNSRRNLQILCDRCNLSKGNKIGG
jgi:Restriction endonuclease